MAIFYRNKAYQNNGKLVYNDNGTLRRVKYVYAGVSDGQGGAKKELVYLGGNNVTYVVDINAPIEEEREHTMFRWNGEDVLKNLDFTPTKEGYTFIGWTAGTTPCAPDGKGTYTKVTMLGEPIVLYANFKKEITLTSFVYKENNESYSFNTNGYLVYNNSEMERPTFTIRQTEMPDYEFKGWAVSTGADAEIAYNEITNIPFAYDTTVYAIYHYRNNVHYGYAVNGSTLMMEGVVAVNAYNTTYARKYPELTLANPTKPLASFLGWSTDGSRNIAYYPTDQPGRHVINLPILIENDGVVFSAIFKYADTPLRTIVINNPYQRAGLIDGNDPSTWLRLHDQDGNELSYDCMMFESVDATGTCSLDQGYGLYLRDTCGFNQSANMLNGSFSNLRMDLPSSGTTTLCVSVMSNSTAYVSGVELAGDIVVIGRTTVG